jgi:hypothetical protein
LTNDLIESWTKKKFVTFDGYRSATLNENVGRNFAARAETDEKDQVLLKINMENESGKYYVFLDTEEYT